MGLLRGPVGKICFQVMRQDSRFAYSGIQIPPIFFIQEVVLIHWILLEETCLHFSSLTMTPALFVCFPGYIPFLLPF